MNHCCRERHEDMDDAKVLSHMCMSLDGFMAQPDDNPAELRVVLGRRGRTAERIGDNELLG